MLYAPRGVGSDGARERDNLVHIAARSGCSSFLEYASDISTDISTDHSTDPFMVACLFRNFKDRTPLYSAYESQDTASMGIILTSLLTLFSDKYTKFSIDKCHHQHFGDLFPLNDFVPILRDYPRVANKFLKELSLVEAYQEIVKKEYPKARIRDGQELIVGSEERSPDTFWTQVQRHRQSPEKDAGTTEEEAIPVTAMVLGIPGIASRESEVLQNAVLGAKRINRFTAFESKTMEVLIDFKWKTYGRSAFLAHLYKDIVMVAAFSLDAILHQSLGSDEHQHLLLTILGYLPMLVTIGLWAFFCRHEANQFGGSKTARAYFGDFWNLLDLASLGSIFATYLLRAAEYADLAPSNSRWSTLMMALALPLAYLNTLYFMQGFKESGQLVRMILGIIGGIRVFVIILLACMIGFAFAFYVLYRGKADYDGIQHRSPFLSLFSSYALLLGDFDVNELEESSSFVITVFLFVGFTFFINIIMLNLLIAIMGDIFDRIQENAVAEFLFARANILLEIEATFGEKEKSKAEWYPRWLQVLVATTEGNESDDRVDWAGRVRALKGAMNKINEQVGVLKDKFEQSEKKREESEKKREESEKILVEMQKEAAEESKKREESDKMLKLLCDKFEISVN